MDSTPEMEILPVKSHLRSEATFQWKKKCFQCGCECLPNDVYYRKVEQSTVEGHDRAMMVDTSIRHAIVDRDHDAWAWEVSGRVAGCIDLFAIEAVYHICLVWFTTFRPKQPGEVLCGRPVNLATVDAFSNLCDYLKTSCDLKLDTLKQLHETMTYLAGPDLQTYGMKYLKLKLEERYGSLSVKLVDLGCSALKDLLNTSLATSGMLTDQMHRWMRLKSWWKELVVWLLCRYVTCHTAHMSISTHMTSP